MDDRSDSVLRVERDDRVVRLTLHRPEALNALDDEVRRALAAACAELEESPDVSIVVLAGAGRAFSAGADLRSTSYPPVEGSWSNRRHATGTWQRLLDQVQRIPQTTVAALHRHVIGGAALLAAACDIRIADPDTTLRIPELAIGIPLTWAGIPLLVREVGLPATRDWVSTCRAVGADELLRTGYVTRLSDPGGLDAAVQSCIDELLAVPPGPLSMTKAMTAALGRSHPAMAAGWGDADHQMWSFTEDEYRDAVAAYVDRQVGGGGAPRSS
ncbi:MAG: enoyl-CoA hydratase/isomerase family protein [Actinomycetota bacterium]